MRTSSRTPLIFCQPDREENIQTKDHGLCVAGMFSGVESRVLYFCAHSVLDSPESPERRGLRPPEKARLRPASSGRPAVLYQLNPGQGRPLRGEYWSMPSDWLGQMPYWLALPARIVSKLAWVCHSVPGTGEVRAGACARLLGFALVHGMH
jgi:hypothetical protein